MSQSVDQTPDDNSDRSTDNTVNDTAEPQPGGQSAEKPTSQWATGDEPMTGPQASYLSTLAREAGEDVPEGLTKASASDMIDRLQSKSSRIEG